jgi:hypothetical protein
MGQDDDDEAEQLSPRIVHYHQTKNGEGSNSKFNSMMLACLLAIVGFLGVQVWFMADRMARLETNVQILLGRP